MSDHSFIDHIRSLLNESAGFFSFIERLIFKVFRKLVGRVIDFVQIFRIGTREKNAKLLAAGIAHEIRNPITVIKTLTDFLPQKYDDPEFREKFTRIVMQEMTRIETMTSSILALSKSKESQKSACEINAVVGELIDLLQEQMARFGIKLDFESRSEHYWVLVNSDEIKQALLNIFLNAIEAVKDREGSIDICVSASFDFCELVISDTGPGISQDKLRTVFEPFVTNKEGGTGLGLSISRSLVERNNGDISIESEIDKGTSFFIRLPLLNVNELAAN